MENKQIPIKDRDIQQVVGNILRYGIWIALLVAAVGGIIYLSRHGDETSHYGTFVEQDVDLFSLIASTLNNVLALRGQSIIMLGIILLFLTPVLRIIFSLIAFFFEQDYLYVIITLIVIGIICFSVFHGFAH